MLAIQDRRLDRTSTTHSITYSYSSEPDTMCATRLITRYVAATVRELDSRVVRRRVHQARPCPHDERRREQRAE